MLLSLELIIKYSAFGLLVMLAMLIIVLERRTWPGRLLILLSLSLASLLVSTVHTDDTPHFIFCLLNVPNTILVWLFVKSLLDEDFTMGWVNWIIAASWCVPLWIMRIDLHNGFNIFSSIHSDLLNIYACILFAYLVFFILKGWVDDLVEPRRRLRLIFVIGVVTLSLFAIISEFLMPTRLLGTFKLIAIFPPLIAAYFWIFRVKPDHFVFAGHDDSRNETVGHKVDPRFESLKQKLDQEIIEHKCWQEADLTIPKLAKRLGTTQHSLRKLINQEMGFQNFRSFMNEYRIEAIKEALVDPASQNIPILNLALENGFNSLPPFNRAFKSIAGITPRTYRQQFKK